MNEIIIGEIYTRDSLERSASYKRNLLVYKTPNKTLRSGKFNEKYKVTNIIPISDCQVYDFIKNSNNIDFYNNIIFAEKLVIKEENTVDISNAINSFYEYN